MQWEQQLTGDWEEISTAIATQNVTKTEKNSSSILDVYCIHYSSLYILLSLMLVGNAEAEKEQNILKKASAKRSVISGVRACVIKRLTSDFVAGNSWILTDFSCKVWAIGSPPPPLSSGLAALQWDYGYRNRWSPQKSVKEKIWHHVCIWPLQPRTLLFWQSWGQCAQSRRKKTTQKKTRSWCNQTIFRFGMSKMGCLMSPSSG